MRVIPDKIRDDRAVVNEKNTVDPRRSSEG